MPVESVKLFYISGLPQVDPFHLTLIQDIASMVRWISATGKLDNNPVKSNRLGI
jgi:hypothetical protein